MKEGRLPPAETFVLAAAHVTLETIQIEADAAAAEAAAHPENEVDEETTDDTHGAPAIQEQYSGTIRPEVCSLGGTLCSLDAKGAMKVKDVKELIHASCGIETQAQTLCFG